MPPCVEDGRTFEENARQKALHFSKCAEGTIFADDSGISVEALGGAPGVHSARFAGPAASDEANNRKLLEALRGVPVAERAVQYVCVIALAQQGKLLTVLEGRADGMILDQARGRGGFGYDPLFFYAPLGKTFAELSTEEKFEVSHRGAAFRKLLDYMSRHGE